MDVHDVKLTISAVAAAQYPEDGHPEIAFLGRSNVGKSSLINKLIQRKAMARTSGVPGKTQTLNFYDLDSRLFFVDVPGYGYAKVSKTARAKFAAMIETYLTTRQPLRGIVLLVDSRHEPTADDISLYQYLNLYLYFFKILSPHNTGCGHKNLKDAKNKTAACGQADQTAT